MFLCVYVLHFEPLYDLHNK